MIQLMLTTTDQYRYYRSLVKYLKKLYINSDTHILNKIIHFMSINKVSGNIALLCNENNYFEKIMQKQATRENYASEEINFF